MNAPAAADWLTDVLALPLRASLDALADRADTLDRAGIAAILADPRIKGAHRRLLELMAARVEVPRGG